MLGYNRHEYVSPPGILNETITKSVERRHFHGSIFEIEKKDKMILEKKKLTAMDGSADASAEDNLMVVDDSAA